MVFPELPVASRTVPVEAVRDLHNVAFPHPKKNTHADPEKIQAISNMALKSLLSF